MALTVEQRFLSKISIDPLGCWNWTAAKNADGYGRFGFEGRNAHAHRVAYVLFIGPIPRGLEVAHLCHNRRCVNPLHIQAMTHLANVQMTPTRTWRRSACKRGHEMEDPNLYHRRNGTRQCLACYQQSWADGNARKSAQRREARNH